MDVPKYCPECGSAFPWTQTQLESARQYALELEELTPADRQLLAGSWEDIATETPRSELAVLRVKKLMRKCREDTARDIMSMVFKIATANILSQFR
jgi:hypothetical protein